MAYLEAEGFVNRLAESPSTLDKPAFNPYRDFCPHCDRITGPNIRRERLRLLIDAAIERGVRDLWVGLAPGWKGARRTGLAFTDDRHVREHCNRWRIPPDNRILERATRGLAIKELSAGAVWRVLKAIDAPIFLWNVFPFHPHQPGDPFTNRAITHSERVFGGEILDTLMRLLGPGRLVAIGKEAERALKRAVGSLKLHAVRHPSYGGITEFTEGVERIYGIRRRERLCETLPGLFTERTPADA